jgi:hypothetical protein
LDNETPTGTGTRLQVRVARLGVGMLKMLQNTPERPPMPTQTHANWLPSADRGVSVAFLRAVRDFYARTGTLRHAIETKSFRRILAGAYRAGLLLIFRSAHREPLQSEPDRLKCLAVGPECVGNRIGRKARIFVEEP